jgi:probable rRNA maturation factor
MPVTVRVAAGSDRVTLTPETAALVEGAVRAATTAEGVSDAELSLTLMDDEAMASLNLRWKERDAPTDVLAFSLHGPGEPPEGDIYLGVERAAAQAEELGESRDRELARVAIHGTLHVLGWDHPERGREASEMWERQERILEGLGVE